jgi:hypothetical protein
MTVNSFCRRNHCPLAYVLTSGREELLPVRSSKLKPESLLQASANSAYRRSDIEPSVSASKLILLRQAWREHVDRVGWWVWRAELHGYDVVRGEGQLYVKRGSSEVGAQLAVDVDFPARLAELRRWG